MQPLSDAFARAADWLEDHSWVQHAYGFTDDKSFWEPGDQGAPFCACALGALATSNRFRRGDEGFVLAAEALAEHVGTLEPPDDPDVPFDLSERFERAVTAVSNWNDNPERTARHVISTLQLLAQKLQNA